MNRTNAVRLHFFSPWLHLTRASIFVLAPSREGLELQDIKEISGALVL